MDGGRDVFRADRPPADGDPANNVPAGSDPASTIPRKRRSGSITAATCAATELAIRGYFQELGVTACGSRRRCGMSGALGADGAGVPAITATGRRISWISIRT